MSDEGRGLRVLVVDDAEGDRRLVREHIRAWDADARIEEADGGEAALELAEPDRFDLLVVDYRMPGMDGIALVERLRSRHIRAPIIMLTGQGDEQVVVAAMKAGAWDYLSKDETTRDRLIGKIESALEAKETPGVGVPRGLPTEGAALLGVLAGSALKGLQTGLDALDEEIRRLEGDLGRRDVDDALLTAHRERLQVAVGAIRQLAGGLAVVDEVLRDRGRDHAVDAGEVVRDVLDRVASLASARVDFDVRIPDGPATVGLSEPALGLVVRHLVNNAVEAMPGGGTVRVRVEVDDEVRVSVEDEGPGIPSELDDPFELGATTKPSHEGLGLPLVRYLVDRAGGSVRHDRTEGDGTRFVVALPRADDGAGDA